MAKSSAIDHIETTANTEVHSLHYRGWLIVQQQLGRQLWLRWQHPQEDFPRYGIPVEPTTWSQRLKDVHRSIDLILQLEAR
ncbi:MAG: hypothetical protein HC838_05765 [Spirulinaceae cyanobacterium RM2_2_10]|nr:hypothetical protein [Spirulinaceae cyanobacterium SM2_1_0]NJO19662.1 hypothetical protein [Spirulinaceae cyanobacterium RM2_2_10]